ncbi:stage V sporulation protein K, partial [Lecanoromycetidae sp. Uapishka_2]
MANNAGSLKFDNQFRLLREDMLSEMRDELSLISGKRAGRHKGIIVDGFEVVGVDCGDPKKRTGKSFIGALIAKSIHRHTEKVMLVVCYTNHALDQFLEDLLDIGIPANEMVRLGGKSSPRTKCLALFDQSANFRQTPATWKMIDELKIKTETLADSLYQAFARYKEAKLRPADLLEYLEFHPDGSNYLEAFTVPENEDGSVTVGRGGKAISESYLIDRWSNNGHNAGIFAAQTTEDAQRVWQMSRASREAAMSAWKHDILKEQVSSLYDIAERYNESQQALAPRDVLLVEEAGEILESHILTALGSQTSQLVLIGDHKQLRPKVNNYALTVEKDDGYDLNRSLFERLILKDFPRETLHQQHRMRPEISALIRSLTYPNLVDAPNTHGRPNLRGFQDNLIYVTHAQPEDDAKDTGNWKDMSSISSKQNRYEVDMVLKCVRYLAQQGYGTEKVVILTPYLGQLHLLQTVLSKENDPILNDLDSFDLVRAGLLPAASAKLSQRKIHLSTIDNYQGEESDIQEQRAKDEEEHAKHIAKLDAMLADERQRMKDAQLSRERVIAIQQKEKDLTQARAQTIRTLKNPLPDPSSNTSSTQPALSASPPLQVSNPVAGPADNGPDGAKTDGTTPTAGLPKSDKWTQKRGSGAKQEWERQKRMENAFNDDIDSVMEMVGLEEVKLQILKIKAKIEVSLRQNADMSKDRLNVVFLGNPGTGKTTVARVYSRILASLGALPGSHCVEITGASLAHEGVTGAKKHLETIQNAGGGAFFIDEAYQLADEHNKGGPVLDFLLAEMENLTGKVVFILAGYNKNMEKFFEHNPGLPSRIPYTLHFTDYQDDELLWILQHRIGKRYNGRMAVEGGNDGLYMRIVVTRLGRRRGSPGFGNARALEVTYSLIAERQAERVTRERKEGSSPDDFFLSKEDLIGPDPSKAILKSPAWDELQSLIGLSMVKDSIKSMIDRISVNYQRELTEKEPVEVSLNRVFLGSPGTGKTSVGKLYGQIMADLGILSNGEVVVKNPSDFLGAFIGHSERNTKAILATTVGKVLIIDEAYMLYTSSVNNQNHSDSFKTAVIDTIVAEVQSVPGDDRCVLLLGYENKMVEMFQNVNPGLSRRFAIDSAFQFEDFTDEELLKILDLKLKKQDLEATQPAKAVAMEVLSRGRNRPNFGNAGEVENLLGRAKGRHQLRQSAKKPTQQSSDIVFEPQDFDPDFDRGANASANLHKLFEGVVGCEDVIAKLSGYQQIAKSMKARGVEPRGMIPTNFLFKGPPGTGKTTTARKLGQVFYDLGYLADVEVVECSASDLIGSYVGHTGPKTRSMLEKALGKVLFVDEAYRLGEGHFATEAINELTDQLTKPVFMEKLIVILAGYDKEINRLITVNPGLSSRFPEDIIFKSLSPHQCLEVLEKSIQQQKIQTPPLTDSNSKIHVKMVDLLKRLSVLPSWGNARDMKTLAKTMVGSVFKTMTPLSPALVLSESEVLFHTETMLKEKLNRSANISSAPSPAFSQQAAEHIQTQAPPPESSAEPLTPEADDMSVSSVDDPPDNPDIEPSPHDPGRDEGVPDDIWDELQADKAAAMAESKVTNETIQKAEEVVSSAKQFEQEQAEALKKLQETKARDEAEAQELKRKEKEARMQEEAARLLREKAKAELERVRIQEVKQKREKQVQSKLREMGVCCMGYQWIKQVSGYRCAGGSHYISNGQLGI